MDITNAKLAIASVTPTQYTTSGNNGMLVVDTVDKSLVTKAAGTLYKYPTSGVVASMISSRLPNQNLNTSASVYFASITSPTISALQEQLAEASLGNAVLQNPSTAQIISGAGLGFENTTISIYTSAIRHFTDGKIDWINTSADLYSPSNNVLKTNDNFQALSVSAQSISAATITVGNIDNTEFNYLNGTSANIQTQINNIRLVSDNAVIKNPVVTQVISGASLGIQRDDVLTNAAFYAGTTSAQASGGFAEFAITNAGSLSWGPGVSVRDVNLYRSAADTLKTDDTFEAGSVKSIDLTDGRIVQAGANGKLRTDDGLSYIRTSNITRVVTIGDGAVAGTVALRMDSAPNRANFVINQVSGVDKWGTGIAATSSPHWRVGNYTSAGVVDYPILIIDGANGPIEFGGAVSARPVRVNSLTANRAVITDASKNLVSSSTTSTELRYLTGTSANIQTQINNIRTTSDNAVVKNPTAEQKITSYALVVERNASQAAVTAQIAGDALSRVALNSNGAIDWGSGAAARDTNLYRAGINYLKTDGVLQTSGVAINTTPRSNEWLYINHATSGKISVNAEYTGAATSIPIIRANATETTSAGQILFSGRSGGQERFNVFGDGSIYSIANVSAADFYDSGFVGSRVLVSNGKNITESSITTTKLGYLANVSADIQSLLIGVGYPVRSEYYFNKSGNIASNTYTSSISLPISANELFYGNAPGGTYQYRYKLRASLVNTYALAPNYSFSLKLGGITLGTCSASSTNEHIWFDVDIVPTGASSFDTFGQCGTKTGIYTCPFQVTNTFNPGILNNLYVVTYGAGNAGACELKKFEIIKYHFNYPLPAGY